MILRAGSPPLASALSYHLLIVLQSVIQLVYPFPLEGDYSIHLDPVEAAAEAGAQHNHAFASDNTHEDFMSAEQGGSDRMGGVEIVQDSDEDNNEAERRQGPSKIQGRNMEGGDGTPAASAGESKSVLSFGGFRVSDKKRVQRESVEVTAPAKANRKHDDEDKERKYTKIDQHCGLGYTWDPNEKVCITT